MKYYKVNTKTKVITINDKAKKTINDDNEICWYIQAGYTVKHKNQSLAKATSNRMKSANLPIDEEITKKLKSNKTLLEKYNAIKTGKGKGTGFFAARAWYLKECADAEK